jgi:hypothetical protein
MGVMSASATMPLAFSLSGCAQDSAGGFAPWPQLTLEPVTAAGYGQDPELITPAPAPWPRLLSESQLALLAVLSDIIVPREGDVPSASEVGVPDVIDEWVSAPYPTQQEHRAVLEPGLRWMDDESMRRHGKTFMTSSVDQQLAMIDDIAYEDRETPVGLEMPKVFFSGLRTLVVGAFFTSPEGIEDLGYIGNTPIYGDYPGPSDEAMAHLDTLLEDLGLSLS